MSDDFMWFVGIDWATARHQACLVDRNGGGREQQEIEHTATGVQEFVDWLRARTTGDLHGVAVAIESPRGALVDTLIELGLAVFAINPKQLDRFRDRHTVAGAKDDRRDALVLADSLRTDRPAFRRVQVDHPLIIQIRALSRAEDDLQIDLGRLTNRLREQVYRLAPGLLTLCVGADEPWLWALLELVIRRSRVTRSRRRSAAARTPDSTPDGRRGPRAAPRARVGDPARRDRGGPHPVESAPAANPGHR